MDDLAYAFHHQMGIVGSPVGATTPVVQQVRSVGLLDFQQRTHHPCSQRAAAASFPAPPHPDAAISNLLSKAGILYFGGGLLRDAQPSYRLCEKNSCYCCSQEIKFVEVNPTRVPPTNQHHHKEERQRSKSSDRACNVIGNARFETVIIPSAMTFAAKTKVKVKVDDAPSHNSAPAAPVVTETVAEGPGQQQQQPVPCFNWNEGRCVPTKPGATCPQVPEGRPQKHHVCRYCLGSHRPSQKKKCLEKKLKEESSNNNNHILASSTSTLESSTSSNTSKFVSGLKATSKKRFRGGGGGSGLAEKASVFKCNKTKRKGKKRR